MTKTDLRIGLFGIGLDAYWDQFPGLKPRLERYLAEVQKNLAEICPTIINPGVIDTVEKAFEAGKRFRVEDVDIIFIYVTTYALSSTVLPVVQRAKVPVIVLNLAPEPSIDYEAFNALADRQAMTAEWLAHCSACPVPELANVFRRTGIPFFQVTGVLHDDPVCWGEIREWIESAKVVKMMQYNRLGCLGHYYGGMLDVYSDLTSQIGHFGGHIEMLEVEELCTLRREVTPTEINQRLELFSKKFDIRE